MNNPTFSFVSSAYGFAFGVFSLVGCAIGMWRSHLPSRKIQVLEELLAQTQDIFHSAVEAGLLPDLEFRAKAEARLDRLREDTFQVRAEAYAATTLYSDYRAFFCGLSFSIAKKCSNLKELRANVITMSEECRLRQNAVSSITGESEQGNIPRDSEPEILSSYNGVGEHSPLPAEPIAESIHRPACGYPKRSRSCPPDLRYLPMHPTSICLHPCRDSTTIGLKIVHELSTDSLNTLVIAESVTEHHSADLDHTCIAATLP